MFSRFLFIVTLCAMLAAAVLAVNSLSASERHSKSPALQEKVPGLQAAKAEMRWFLSRPAVLRGWRQMA